MNALHVLRAGHLLTVSVVDGSAHIRQVEDPSIAAIVTNSAARSFGPYFLDRSFVVKGVASVVISEADKSALLNNIPTTDQEDSVTVWNDGGVLKVSTSGA
jgi:hypothetical protein